MANLFGFQNRFRGVNLRGTHHFCRWTFCNLFLRYCQIHTQSNTFQRNRTVTKLRLNNFICKTKSIKEMATNSISCPEKMLQTDSFTESDQRKLVLETYGQSKDEEPITLSKKAMKRLARAQKHKEYKKRKREENLQMIQRDGVGYSVEDLQESSYYFENGVRKVYPYTYVFATHAKGRWVGRRIQDVLEKEFGYDQPDDLVKSFEKGLIHVNGKQASLNYVIRSNDYICHRTHRHENPVTDAPIEIIENNDDVVVINKPSSIPCHPCGRYRFNSVVFILGKEMGLVNLRNIYRLDRLTSGVLILAKSPERTKMFMDQVANREVQKEYVCRVVGEFPDGLIKVDQPLKALSNKLRLQVVSPTGKSSQTTFTRISYNGNSSVVRCIPHTGRTHQIRVHLQYLGHPIINDAFYNSESWGPNKGKNGIYEIPHDKVCEHILADHHEKLWTGGDNPLYEQKLKQMKAMGQQSGSISFDDIPVHDDLTEASCNKCTDVSSTVDNDEVSTASIWEHAEADQHQDTNICSQNVSGLLKNSPGDKIVNPEPLSSSSVLSETRTDSNPCSKNSTIDKQATEISTTKSDSSNSQRTTPLPDFELSKWSVDLSCDLCKKQPIDPEVKDLVMFLHAIKYKGPGWEYETALPDWASEDWNREKDFVLGNANCLKS